jgi:Ca2+-binding RTX toxin-like protein
VPVVRVLDRYEHPRRNDTTMSNRTTARNRLPRIAAGLLAAGAAVLAVPGVADAAPPFGGSDKLACPGTTIHAKPGQTVVHGTCGNDLIFLSDNAATVYAYGGDDDIRAGWGGKTVTLHLGAGNDEVSNNGDKKVIAYGEAGNDILEGGHLDDALFGGEGHDDLFGGPGANSLHGGNGSDFLDSTSSLDDDAADFVYGGAGADVAIYEQGDHLSQVEAASPTN